VKGGTQLVRGKKIGRFVDGMSGMNIDAGANASSQKAPPALAGGAGTTSSGFIEKIMNSNPFAKGDDSASTTVGGRAMPGHSGKKLGGKSASNAEMSSSSTS
jgi:hypothetical protein